MAKSIYAASGTTKDGGCAWEISASKLEQPRDSVLFWSAANGVVFGGMLKTEQRADSWAAIKRLFGRNKPTHGIKLLRTGSGPLFVQTLELVETRLTSDKTCELICRLVQTLLETKMRASDWAMQPGATASEFWHGCIVEAFLRIEKGFD